MAEGTLILEQLCVHRFRGVQRPQDRLCLPENGRFGPGVNLVYGPNASGKTTAALALQHLIWPEEAPAHGLHAAGRLAAGNVSWAVEVDAGQVRRDGVPPTGLPRLPSAQARNRYRLALHELLQAEDRDLAGLVQREVNGGLDLDAARQALEFGVRTRTANLGEARSFRQAAARVRELQGFQSALRRQAQELATLRAQAAAARSARDRLTALDTVLEWRQRQADLAAAEAALAQFDPTLARLRGTELETVEALTEETARKRRALAGVEEVLARPREQEDASGFEDAADRVAEVLSVLRSLQSELAQLDKEQARLDGERAAAQATVDTARAAMGAALREEQLEALSDTALADVTDFGREAAECRAHRRAFEILQTWLENPESADDGRMRTLQRGLDLLHAWLRERSGRGPRSLELGALCGLALGTALLLGWLVHPAWLLLLVPGTGFAWRLLRLQPRQRGSVRADYESLQLPLPSAWDPTAVTRTCETLSDELASWRLRVRQAEFLRAHEAERTELEALARRLEEKRELLEQQLGVAPGFEDGSLYLLVRNLATWQQARAALAAATGRLAALQTRRTARLTAFNAGKAPLFPDSTPCADSVAALAAVEAAEKRWQQCVASRERLEAAAQRRTELCADLDELRTRELAVFAVLEAPAAVDTVPGRNAATARLRLLLSDLEAYSGARRAVRDTQRDCDLVEHKLRALPGFTATLLELASSAAAELRDQAAAQAGRAQELDRQVTEIQTRIDGVRRNRDLEQALAAAAEARAALRAVRERDATAAVGDVLIRAVQGRSQQRASAVLSAARRLFGTITQHRYELQLGTESGPAFMARDTATAALRDLDTLSSATRVQLLLAVRVAFIEVQEGDGPRLPLILDEILGNSDDARAAAIIDAVLTLAAAGRQVFYFTAQYDEIGKWRAALPAHGAKSCREFTLPALSQREQPFRLAIDRPEPNEVPAPGASSHAEYGAQLGVPRFDPSMPDAGRLHLWYLVTDVEALHALLQRGYRTWGQLASLAANGGEHVLEQLEISRDALLMDRARARADILTQLAGLWRVGRGEMVDRGVLRASAAVSVAFLDAVTACAEQAGGDAARLLEALQAGAVKGFRKKKLTGLEEYLAENGFLDQRPRLAPDEMRVRLDALAAPVLERGLITAAELEAMLATVAAS